MEEAKTEEIQKFRPPRGAALLRAWLAGVALGSLLNATRLLLTSSAPEQATLAALAALGGLAAGALAFAVDRQIEVLRMKHELQSAKPWGRSGSTTGTAANLWRST